MQKVITMKLVQVRLDDQLFTEAGNVLERLGLDVPTAFRLYMKAIVRERGIPFPLRDEGVRVEEVPVDDELQAAMDAAVSGWKSKKAPSRHGRHPRRHAQKA